MLNRVDELPQTQQELWAALPRDAWVGTRLDLASTVAGARDHLDSVCARAQRDVDAAKAELTQVVLEAWLSGASWRTIGVLLGTSRQAAARRFGEAVRQAVDAIDAESEG
jgi:hypothetical protein